MVRYLPVPAEVLYLLMEKVNGLVQEHNRVDPEAHMPKVVAEEYSRKEPDWSLALEWRTRQGVASFNLHANHQRVGMTFIFLREAMAPKTWAETLHHPGKAHWNAVIDYIAGLGDFTIWNHEVQRLKKELTTRKNASPAAGA
jgi:hypothetical protein